MVVAGCAGMTPDDDNLECGRIKCIDVYSDTQLTSVLNSGSGSLKVFHTNIISYKFQLPDNRYRGCGCQARRYSVNEVLVGCCGQGEGN